MMEFEKTIPIDCAPTGLAIQNDFGTLQWVHPA